MRRKIRKLTIAGHTIAKNEQVDLMLDVSQQYTGSPIQLPIRVIRSAKAGPTVLITAAVHGDEFTGVGIIHELMHSDVLKILKGTLILVPVVNVFGFENQERYMPDRRDLNRCFPGSETGSLSARFANIIFNQLIMQADYCIDLHSAAQPRTNYPNVRGDFRDPEVRRLCRAFGCELMLDSKGPDGSLRREATKSGCPTMILEAGEPCKLEPSIHEVGLRGVKNVLTMLDMLEGEVVKPPYQSLIKQGIWVRASIGGILRFHVSPGEIVEEGQPIATNANVFGQEQSVLVSPVEGIILGMTTLPAIKPGEPVCHVAIPTKSMTQIRKILKASSRTGLYHRVRKDMASSISKRDIATSDNEASWAPAAQEPED
ncbi:MAG: succinylglutamate desuccinylase/aspartoacylase family protein [Phycisphaeraceae bacterium JB051]